MHRSFLSRILMAATVMGLPALSACCSDGKCAPAVAKVYEDRYETVKCTNCQAVKYVYHQAPCPPEKVIRIHRVKEACPPPKVVEVTLPAPVQKVKYEYLNEGSCAKPCRNPCD